jgi:hypothetical protein
MPDCRGCYLWDRDDSVCIATDYGMDDRMIEVRILTEAGNFSLSYSVGNGGCLPGGKVAVESSWPLTSI